MSTAGELIRGRLNRENRQDVQVLEGTSKP
jgi:hypothetical protein